MQKNLKACHQGWESRKNKSKPALKLSLITLAGKK
jgi:hypothetical protein